MVNHGNGASSQPSTPIASVRWRPVSLMMVPVRLGLYPPGRTLMAASAPSTARPANPPIATTRRAGVVVNRNQARRPSSTPTNRRGLSATNRDRFDLLVTPHTTTMAVMTPSARRCVRLLRRHSSSGLMPYASATMLAIRVAQIRPSRRGSASAAQPATSNQSVEMRSVCSSLAGWLSDRLSNWLCGWPVNRRSCGISKATHTAIAPPMLTVDGFTVANVPHAIGVNATRMPAPASRPS